MKQMRIAESKCNSLAPCSGKEANGKIEYPKEWKDSFGLPVEEHRKALEINMLKGYAEFTTPK